MSVTLIACLTTLEFASDATLLTVTLLVVVPTVMFALVELAVIFAVVTVTLTDDIDYS